MNKENIEILAKVIEEQKPGDYVDYSGFNMAALLHSCGSPMCIAGFAAWLKQGKPDTVNRNPYSLWEVEDAAAAFLGFGPFSDDAVFAHPLYPLFYPPGNVEEGANSYYGATPAQAARVLRHLGKTGKVDWKVSGIVVNEEEE